jgi:1-acyl-sn-glycerol-3-phosphate acyltransferase
MHAGARFVAQRLLLKPLVWSLVHVTTHHAERLDRLPGTFVVVANHSSHLDAPLVMGALPHRFSRYLAAAAAADYFFDVWWRKGLTALFFNAFPVDRVGELRSKGLATTLLEDGVPVLIFPEGTRSRDTTIAPFKAGAAALSIKAQAPVVPVAVHGAQAAMPRTRNWPVRGRPPVAIAFGEPLVHRSGETVTAFNRRIESSVRDLYLSLAEPGDDGQRRIDPSTGASRNEGAA